MCFFMVGIDFNANAAACGLFACNGRQSDADVKAASSGSNQCYYCNDRDAGNKECKEGDIIGVVDEHRRIVSLWQCTVKWNGDAWAGYNTSVICKNSPIQATGVPNTEHFFDLEGGVGTASAVSGEDVVLKAGNTACLWIECAEGFFPSDDRKECIDISEREEACTSSGGTWNNNKCFCMADKGLEERDSSGVCTCVNAPDYEYSATDGKCVKTQAAREREEEEAEEAREREEAAAVEANKRKCETSGGTWSGGKCSCDAAKNLRTENGVCVCTDSNYKRDGDRCVLTDLAALQKECLTDDSKNSGAWWDSVSKQCKCSNPRHVWMGTCVENPAILSCNKISGAQWNELEQKCSCIDPNKTINSTGTECVLTQEAVISISISSSKTKISNAVAKLNKIASEFDPSVWKNAEGEFNTSRLISDSVAGVVLGTAGGLITSSVVKKNQVESGFEDIQCTVGGQVVAGWGDQFRVGIQ